MLSECSRTGTSYISSKRVMGVFITTIVMGCTIYLVWTEGGTDVVENLLQTSLIIAASLLGISSITGIWKSNNVNIGNKEILSEELNNKEKKKENIECPCIKKAP